MGENKLLDDQHLYILIQKSFVASEFWMDYIKNALM